MENQEPFIETFSNSFKPKKVLSRTSTAEESLFLRVKNSICPKQSILHGKNQEFEVVTSKSKVQSDIKKFL